jgi:hypothetical protein
MLKSESTLPIRLASAGPIGSDTEVGNAIRRGGATSTEYLKLYQAASKSPKRSGRLWRTHPGGYLDVKLRAKRRRRVVVVSHFETGLALK